MSVVSMRELLEAGVHFGHQTRRWNPKMRRFIFTERGGIYIIDLQQTLQLLEEANAFARNVAERGGSILFVGTKKQSQGAVEEQAVREARRLGLPVVALVDTNCDPDEADYVIPGNDDAIRSCDLIVRVIADGIYAGQQKVTPGDFKKREPEPVAEAPTVPEGDYEQVSPGDERVAEDAVPEEAVPEEVHVDG